MNHINEIKKLEDFQKYARFICDHFDIEIELDSTKAETNGRVIKLPNVMGLNEQELDIMYTILLHEAGHIKFSVFTEAAFLKIKTQAHAYLSNSIEDARIENLLMKDFAGARDMFHTLYSDYAVTRKFMKKVFNISGKRPDLFNCLGIYVHSRLIDCKTAAFSRVATRTNYAKIKSFVKKYNINHIIDNAPLKHWDHVIDLTNTIYDLFIKEFKDDSKQCNFAQDLALKQQVEKKLDAIKKEIETTQDRMNFVQEKIDQLTSEYQSWEDNNSDKLEDIEFEQRKLGEQLNEHQTEINKRRIINKYQNNLNNTDKQLSSLRDKSQKIEQEIASIKEKISNGINSRGKPFTEKQSDANQKSLDSKERTKSDLSRKIRETKEKQYAEQKQLNDAKISSSKRFKNLSDDEILENIAQLCSDKRDIDEQYSQLTQERTAIEQAINQLQSQIDSSIAQLHTKIINEMYELDELGMGQEIPLDILPEFEENPSWHEADVAQKEFDRNASATRKEVVRNGGRMAGLIGTNLRDLSIYIDKKIEQVKDINLLDIFEKKAGVSRFPELNNGDNGLMTNDMTDKSIRSQWGSIDQHTVLTTQFDIIKNDNTNKNYKESQKLLNENFNFIQSLKRTFINKFKFSKKDYFRGGKEEGQLDTRNLWKLPTQQGDDYFEINHPKFVNKIAASILIDVSGSHDKEETEYGKKLKVIALALSESLKAVHVNHEILGFHAPVSDEMRSAHAAQLYNRRTNRLETIVYKTFAQKDNYGISNLEIQSSDNSDGESVRIAVQRLKRERAKSKVLFIITDGKPFLSDSDVTILDEDLKAALREAVNNKVQIFALGFSPNGQDFYANRFCHIKQYNDVIKFVEKMAL